MSWALVEIDVEIVARTERAVLVHTGDKEAAAWLSIAQVEVAPSGIEGIYSVTMPAWLAVQEGLV